MATPSLGWLRSACGPGYLCELWAWQVCQLRALWPSPCCSRSDSPAGSAAGAAPTQPRPTAKCSSKGQVRRHRPEPLPRAHPAPGCGVGWGGSPGPFAPTGPADSLFQFLPPWSPWSISALYCFPAQLPFFSTLPDPNSRGRSWGGGRLGALLPAHQLHWTAGGCVRSHPHSWSHAVPTQHNTHVLLSTCGASLLC